MEEAECGLGFGPRIELDELAVVDLDEGLGDGAVLLKRKGLLVAESLVERTRGGDVGHAYGDVGEAVDGRALGRLGLRRGGERGEQEGWEERSAEKHRDGGNGSR